MDTQPTPSNNADPNPSSSSGSVYPAQPSAAVSMSAVAAQPSQMPSGINPLIAGEWPGGWTIVKRSIVDFFTNIVPFLVALLAVAPLIIAILLLVTAGHNKAGVSILALVFGIVGVIALIFVGLCSVSAVPLYGLTRADGRKMSTKEFFHVRWTKLWKIVVLEILLAIPIIIGLVLLIIPGLVVLYFLLPVLAIGPFLIIEQAIGPIDAIKAAYAMSKAHRRKFFGIIGWYFLLILLIAVPIILTFVVINSAHAASSATNSSGGHGSGGSGGGGGGDPFSAISFAYLYRWIQHQSAPPA